MQQKCPGAAGTDNRFEQIILKVWMLSVTTALFYTINK